MFIVRSRRGGEIREIGALAQAYGCCGLPGMLPGDPRLRIAALGNINQLRQVIDPIAVSIEMAVP